MTRVKIDMRVEVNDNGRIAGVFSEIRTSNRDVSISSCLDGRFCRQGERLQVRCKGDEQAGDSVCTGYRTGERHCADLDAGGEEPLTRKATLLQLVVVRSSSFTVRAASAGLCAVSLVLVVGRVEGIQRLESQDQRWGIQESAPSPRRGADRPDTVVGTKPHDAPRIVAVTCSHVCLDTRI